MGKKLTALLMSAILATSTTITANAAPTYKTVSELLGTLLSCANGNLKTEYELPATISSPTEWARAISTATEQLTGSITLNITNFDNDNYNLKKIADYNISIKAEGVVSGTDATITYNFTYSPNYKILRAFEDSSLKPCLTADELAALERAYEIKNEIITSTMSNYEKELAIHDYLVGNYQYNVAAATDSDQNVVRAHSITGLLIDGTGVCEAYSNTFMLLCRMAGLNCELATGTLDGVKHEWNIVELGGEYYNVDLTSDDPVPDITGRVRYTCFNVSDEELSKTHVLDSTNRKCDGTRFNYYVYNNLAVANAEDLRILISDKISRGIKTITFKTVGGYVLNNSDDIKAAAENKGLTNMMVSGEYGKEGIFTVVLS